ncbi:MAG: FAD-dependent oxidoreductase [Gammaproteobacteria bacterium]|nr:FAD-dependent oxidoreductase [Gammaproteobacteria bacterium]
MMLDFLIVGQGLAGSLLAWELIERGQRILIIDNENANSASRIAAGIINPITGQRLVKSWHVDALLPTALNCYQILENKFARRFYQQRRMLRLFRSEKQLALWQQRRHDLSYDPYLGEKFSTGTFGDKLVDPLGGFEQLQTGFLMVRELLDALKQFFISRQCFHAASIDYEAIDCEGELVKWGGFQAQRIIFCEGFNAKANPWFKTLPYQPSKGEVITLTTDVNLPQYIINDGHWLVPLIDNVYRVGATYSWDVLNSTATEEGRQELMASIQRKLIHATPLHIIEHNAGVRSTTKDKKPFIGVHSKKSKIAIFNGFGSKGALMIPYFTSRLCDYLLQGISLPPEVDIKRFAKEDVSLVQRAHQLVECVASPGDAVIDATIGNGHDTLFLARCVGEGGVVYGFDLQQAALEHTQQRLKNAKQDQQVVLCKLGHENLDVVIPRYLHGKISAVMFNLGYLPGNNKTIITRTATTLRALEQAARLLKVNGVIVVVAYSGHPGGAEELQAVKASVRQWENTRYDVEIVLPSSNDQRQGLPELMSVKKIA